MSATLARLRKRAAEFEQKKQFDRALEVYVQILDEGGKDLGDEDVPLFNRVGDMLMRKGSVTEALGYYERAVDMYAERGYLNNAIALCSKILRQSPGRAAVYYKLARISAKKGFKSDARKNFLEYADRMQKLGMADEAFRALKEFASLYPDQDDVRLVLAELLSKENRKGEALEQLQSLYEKLQSEGRAAEARATVDRMRAIDPSVTPREGSETQAAAPGDLVFLDLSDSESTRTTPEQDSKAQPVSARAPMPTPVPALEGLSITFLPSDNDVAPHPEGFESTAVEPEPPEVATVTRSLTPQATELVVESAPLESTVEPVEEAGPPLDLTEPASASDLHRVEEALEDLLPEPAEPESNEKAASVEAPSPVRASTPLSGIEFAGLELDDLPRDHASPEHDLALPGELPVPPDDAPAVQAPSPASAAAAEDAWVAAEEAAAMAADIALREAAQQVQAAATPLPTSAEPAESTQLAQDDAEEPAPAAEPGFERPEASNDLLPDDFLALPPSFGATSEEMEEHAFPPLPGLSDAEVETDETLVGTGSAPHAGASHTPHATISIGSAEAHLRRRLELEPENWELRRQLGEALLDNGDRDGGFYELELAMVGFELRGELDRAQEVIDEILRLVPESVGHHQKRVEYAVRSRDRERLTTSYLELADALFRTGAGDKAVAVYSRVLELDRDNERAEFALATLAPGELARLRGTPLRPERWTDELDAIGGGEARGVVSGQEREVSAAPAPDESTEEVPGPASQMVEAAAPSAPAGAKIASIELPDPDWGEGVPVRGSHPGAQDDESPAVLSIPRGGAADLAAPDHVAEEHSATSEQPEPAATEVASAEESGDDRYTETQAPAEEPSFVPAASQRTSTPWSAPRTPTPEQVPVSRTPTPAPAPFRVPVRSASTPASEPTVASRPDSSGNGAQPSSPDSDFIDLGEWLRNTEPTRSTRMQVEDPKPTGDEQADFEEMLRRFKRGVAENVEAEDYDAHYDLGVAYKEMGLVDEAIAQFQKALRGASHRVRSYEALGQCFVEKQQFPIAAALLQRATEVPGSDDQQLVGVLYLLGFAMEHLGRPAEALPYYLRVFAVDIEFRDIAERVAAMGSLTR